MKHFTKILLLCLAVCSQIVIKAQSTQFGLGPAGHMAGPGGVAVRYCGWDVSAASNAIPFNLEHRGTNSIDFSTGGTQRMTILGTSSGATAGFVGMGNGFVAPVNLLHLNGFGNNTGLLFRTDGNQTLFNRWQMFTGPNGGPLSEKGAFFTAPNANTQTGTVLALTNAAVNPFVRICNPRNRY